MDKKEFNLGAKFDDKSGAKNSVVDKIYSDLFDKSPNITIVAKLGFNDGLEFLSLAKTAIKSGSLLHYVAIESSPFSALKLAQIYKKLGIYKKLSSRLIALYPNLDSGLHRVKFHKNITLDLFFGDLKTALDELDFEANCWFVDCRLCDKFDGFFESLAGLCKDGARLVCFGGCAKNEIAKRFEIKSVLLNGKDEIIMANLIQKNERVKDAWFARVEHDFSAKSVVVVGGGISGLLTARELKRVGMDVVVVEKSLKIASNGSGNLIGALMPLITKRGVLLGEVHLRAFELAHNFYKKKEFAKFVKFGGAKIYAYDDMLLKRYQSHSSSWAKFELSTKPYPSVKIERGAYIRVKKLVKYLTKQLDVRMGFEFVGFEKASSGYELFFANGETLRADNIVFAMGSESLELFGAGKSPKAKFDKFMQLSFVRGQVTWLKPCVKTAGVISARGYITPEVGGIQLIGSTYDRFDYTQNSREIDDVKNLQQVEEFLPKTALKIVGSRVGFRGYSGDRFSVIGALCDSEWFLKEYKNLLWSKNKTNHQKAVYHKGIYINTAHGSRGLAMAVLGAELIGDLISSRPLCVEKSITQSLNPSRFLVRKLKKGMIKADFKG